MSREEMNPNEFYKLIGAMGHAAARQKRTQGETMGPAPVGFVNIHRDGRSVVEPNPDTFRLVEQARLLRRQGKSIRQICREMKERGLRSRRGKAIGPSSMLLILQREDVRST